MRIAVPSLSGSSTNFTFHAPCPSCTCEVSLQKEALARVANSQRLNQLPWIDKSTLVIEDSFGTLIHAEGNLSFLTPYPPVVGEEFSSHLNRDIQDAYKGRQRWVWDLLDETPQHEALKAGGRTAFFLPMYVNKEMYTVTVFTK